MSYGYQSIEVFLMGPLVTNLDSLGFSSKQFHNSYDNVSISTQLFLSTILKTHTVVALCIVPVIQQIGVLKGAVVERTTTSWTLKTSSDMCCIYAINNHRIN